MRTHLTNDTTLTFKSTYGQRIVIDGLEGQGLFESVVGQIYTELVPIDCNFTSGSYLHTFSGTCRSNVSPHIRTLERHNGGPLITNGVTYDLMATPSSIEYVSLAVSYSPRGIYRLADGRVLYVSTLVVDGFTYREDYRAFLGDGVVMERLTGVKGGYQSLPRIDTSAGTLYLARNGIGDTWGIEGMPVTRLRLNDFTVVETAYEVTITAKATAKV